MNSPETAKNTCGDSTEDEFALAIANLSQDNENEYCSNKPKPSHIRKEDCNTKVINVCQSGPSGYSLRSTPTKKQDVFSDKSSETPKKRYQRRNIFQTPTKSPSKTIDSSNKSLYRKIAIRKRGQENEKDQSLSKKRCKVLLQKGEEKTGGSEKSKDSSDIDKALEFKASKIKMNAKNVKTLLRQVLTNPSVLNMFKDVLELETEDADHIEYEPMMTRAKVKDLLERVSVASPSKKPANGPSILDVDFAEEEEDDEYDPAKDEGHDSDEDETESMLSSRFSDFGSPCPRTPTTPRQLPETKSGGLRMNLSQVPFPQIFTSPAQASNTSGDHNASVHESEESVNTIALRTRSKLPLHSTSITDIENAFVAPDITPDMYYTNDDADWNQFLSTLYKQPALEFIKNISQEEEKVKVSKNRSLERVYFEVTAAQKLAIYRSPAFVYPHLLLTFKSAKEAQKRKPFLPSEDNQEELDDAVFAWFRQAMAMNVPLSGPVVKGKAAEVVRLINFNSTPIPSWVEKFKQRKKKPSTMKK
ncbi:GON-4-like protein [Elysia marginata]|uniref:GON-4-like protein n=1 Tax=Elysia marginata TaxID=1093978 RepID=A0AAV4ID59_9GAST|nr:GON-4-like protein [Elysia marginata]